jgi:hypothetical protein
MLLNTDGAGIDLRHFDNLRLTSKRTDARKKQASLASGGFTAMSLDSAKQDSDETDTATTEVLTRSQPTGVINFCVLR